MRIFDVNVDLSSPDARKQAIDSLAADLSHMSEKERKNLLERVDAAMAEMAAGKTPMAVNLTQVIDRLDRMYKALDAIQAKFKEFAQETLKPESIHRYGTWDGMLVIAMGAIHVISEGLKHDLSCECETERPPAPDQS